MKAIVLMPSFLADLGHLEAAAESVDICVFSTTYRPPWYQYQPQPPVSLPHRMFDVRSIWRDRGHLWWWYEGLGRALDAEEPDVAHVLSEPWGALAQQAASWANRRPEVALVIHGCDRIWWHGWRLEQRARRVLARRALARADGFLAETEEAIRRALETGLHPTTYTRAVHTNPRDPQRFRPPSQQERVDARRRLGLPLMGTGVGFIGALRPEKGPLVFLESVRRLRAKGQGDWWAAIAGDGPIRAEVHQESLETMTSFLGGVTYPDGVSAFMRAVDVLAIPSYGTVFSEEQSPRVAIEAMLSGCRVVASSCGALPEMLGDAAHLVPERDAQALADGLARAMKPKEALVESGRARARERYSTEAVANQLVEAWSEVVARRGTRV